jgi:hypothetical protein
VDGVSYLLCKSDGRKEKESAMRNKNEEKLETELNNLTKQIINGRENNPVNSVYLETSLKSIIQ